MFSATIELQLELSAKKVVPREQSSTLLFFEKIMKPRVSYDQMFSPLASEPFCCQKVLLIQNFSQFDVFFSNALHRRLTTESIKLIIILLRTFEK